MVVAVVVAAAAAAAAAVHVAVGGGGGGGGPRACARGRWVVTVLLGTCNLLVCRLDKSSQVPTMSKLLALAVALSVIAATALDGSMDASVDPELTELQTSIFKKISRTMWMVNAGLWREGGEGFQKGTTGQELSPAALGSTWHFGQAVSMGRKQTTLGAVQCWPSS